MAFRALIVQLEAPKGNYQTNKIQTRRQIVMWGTTWTGVWIGLWPWLCRVWLSHRHLSLLLFPKPMAAFLEEAGSWTKNQTLTLFGIRFCFSSLPSICPSSWMLNSELPAEGLCGECGCTLKENPAAPALPITAPFNLHWGFCGTTPKLKACFLLYLLLPLCSCILTDLHKKKLLIWTEAFRHFQIC